MQTENRWLSNLLTHQLTDPLTNFFNNILSMFFINLRKHAKNEIFLPEAAQESSRGECFAPLTR